MRWLKTFIVRCYLNNIGVDRLESIYCHWVAESAYRRSESPRIQHPLSEARSFRLFYAWDLCPPQSSNGVHYTVMLTIFLIILKIVTVKLFALFL